MEVWPWATVGHEGDREKRDGRDIAYGPKEKENGKVRLEHGSELAAWPRLEVGWSVRPCLNICSYFQQTLQCHGVQNLRFAFPSHGRRAEHGAVMSCRSVVVGFGWTARWRTGVGGQQRWPGVNIVCRVVERLTAVSFAQPTRKCYLKLEFIA
uniref:Uncharacterized protein n=1 Tax=Oryza meridionalis TaxID=40149 RepID=A0A0E0ED37_9ORYZ